MASYPYRSWVEISRDQIAANFRAVCAAVGPEVLVAPVVKADAYRHGAAEVSRVLESAGARWLAVSNVEEGIALREAGRTSRILVMADFLPFGRQPAAEHNLTQVLHAIDEIPELDELARKLGRKLPYHLKIDSGMGRLGTCATAAEIIEAVNGARACELEGLMSHFASPADFEKEQTAQQIRCFQSLTADLAAAGVRPRYLHMSSTNAIIYGRRAAWFNMVRPGHAIYGYVSPARGPAPDKTFVVRPVLAWKAAILTVKEVAEGSLIGYGGIFRAPKPMRIGVLAAGYADGIPHRLSNRGRVIAAGKFASILGAVSMDLTTVDLTDAPHLKVGDSVTLLGREGEASQDAQQMARSAGTISYVAPRQGILNPILSSPERGFHEPHH
jgi:alanine racemase